MNNSTPSFDGNGYPTSNTLDMIKSWDYPFAEFWDFFKSAWNGTYGKIIESDSMIKLITGGWSGNEELVAALQENTLFWTCYWKASVRGGIEVFDKPSKFEVTD